MTETTTLKVIGMTCGHCVAAVTDEVSKIAKVRSVEVRLEDGTVTVQSDGPLDPHAIAAAIDEAGFEMGS